MKKLIKNYNSFVNENVNDAANELGPQRKFSKENKYKFQMEYSEEIENKLKDYNFTFHVPDENVDKVEDKNFLVIDILNLSYSIESDENLDIRTIFPSKLDHILDNL